MKIDPFREAVAGNPSDLGKRCSGDITVRLLEPERRSPLTVVERAIVATLRREGPTRLNKLVKRVAGEVYVDEVRRGAAVLDIGLFGPDLFFSEVAAEICAQDGLLWKRENPE